VCIPALALLLLSAAPRGIEEDFSRGMANWWVEGGERVWVENGRLQMKADPATGTAGNVATVWRRGVALPTSSTGTNS